MAQEKKEKKYKIERIYESDYIYTIDEAIHAVKENKPTFDFISMESQSQDDGTKIWRIVGGRSVEDASSI